MWYLHLITVEFLHRPGTGEAVGTSVVKRDDEVPIPANFPFVFGGVKAEHTEKKTNYRWGSRCEGWV